jgi:anti-sigma-K factor RskA
MKSPDRQSLEEQMRLVSRYVAGDLSRSERAEFEAWLVASPELASEVEMERRLRLGIASAARRGWLTRDVARAPGRQQRFRIALAASLIIALVTLGLSLVLPHRDAEQPGTSAAVHRAPISRIASRTVHLSAVRGIASSPDIAITQADAPTTLVVEPDVVTLVCDDGTPQFECAGGAAPATPAYPEYEADLVKRRDSSLIWRSARQSPMAHSLLSFSLRDPAALEPGDYDIIVRGHAPDHEEIVGRFWLRVSAR